MSHENPAPANLKDLVARAISPLKELFDEPLPQGVGWFQTTGSLCLFMAALQVVTGILMALYYAPSPDSAWESIRYVEDKVVWGRVIHGLHHWGSSGFVVMVFIHMIRVFIFGAYKGRRKWTWIIGVGLFFTVLGFGFTGYLLPWDMKAYFGSKVGTNILGYTPGVGSYAREFLLGGKEITELTLPRFYALHILILPLALGALIGAHLYLIRLYGITPPWKRDDEAVEYPFRFFPEQAFRDSTMILLAAGLMVALAYFVGADLEEKADPLSSAYAPHPEWYFLGLQELLRYFKGPALVLGTFVIPFSVVLGMLLLPFVDRNPERRISKRPIAMAVAILAVLGPIGFTTKGYLSLRRERREVAEIAGEEFASPAEKSGDALSKLPVSATPQSKETAAQATPTAAPSEKPPEASAATPKQFDSATIDFGKELYQSLDCAKCHTGEKVGHDLNVPPSLDFAGDRFTPEWLMTYLKEVPPRRYESKGRHPVERMPDFKLSDRELEGLTAYLATCRKPELFPAKLDPSQSTPEKIAHGKQLFDSEKCAVCHALGGRGGRSAPDLTGVGKRLKPDFIFQMIKQTQSIVPNTTMENSLLEDGEIQALSYFLLSQ